MCQELAENECEMLVEYHNIPKLGIRWLGRKLVWAGDEVWWVKAYDDSAYHDRAEFRLIRSYTLQSPRNKNNGVYIS